MRLPGSQSVESTPRWCQAGTPRNPRLSFAPLLGVRQLRRPLESQNIQGFQADRERPKDGCRLRGGAMRGVLLDPPLKSRAAPLAKSEETQRLSYVPAPSLRLGPWARARGPGPRYRGAPGCPALQHPRPEQARPQQARPQRGSNVRRSVYPRDAPIVRMRRRTFEPRCCVVPYQNPSVPDQSGCWIATPRLVTPGRSRFVRCANPRVR